MWGTGEWARWICPRLAIQAIAATVLLGCNTVWAQSIAGGLLTDQTNYNVGATVMVRVADESVAAGPQSLSIRYEGESRPMVTGLKVTGPGYGPLWTIPQEARTGRYAVELEGRDGTGRREVGSFAVHRQLAKVTAFELDKTFYTAGDAVTPRIVVENVSRMPLRNLQVEFEAYTYPWIAPAPDEAPGWKVVAAKGLTLQPGERKEFRLERAAVLQTDGSQQTYVYYSAVIRDSEVPDRIYDLAFAAPAITAPMAPTTTKTYPALYQYPKLAEVKKGESYHNFYPSGYVSDVLRFDTGHTMFGTQTPVAVKFAVTEGYRAIEGAAGLELRLLDQGGKVLRTERVSEAAIGEHMVALGAKPAGLYTAELRVVSATGLALERVRLDLAVNELPRSLVIFCAHEDDDTADPALIRAAVENGIPVHVVYFTSGDAGGCDRYYMHSCDASRAMDFGEVRMDEARASLRHLGVPRENVFFLGLPDGGMEQIWQHRGANAEPYLSVLLASDHAPYREAAVANLPYAREAVLAATKEFLLRWKPDLVLTGHPDERHVDHRTNNWIVVKAMQELLQKRQLSAEMQLVVDQVYGPGPQKHAPYRYEKLQFYVSGEAAKLGQEASWYYQSQDGNHQQAEIVPYGKLPRVEPPNHWGNYFPPYPHYRILDWRDHEGWNE